MGPLNVIPWFEEDGRELFQAARQYDLEGIVAKRKADPYEGETRWFKIKTRHIVRRKAGELFELRCADDFPRENRRR